MHTMMFQIILAIIVLQLSKTEESINHVIIEFSKSHIPHKLSTITNPNAILL